MKQRLAPSQQNVKFLRHLSNLACALALAALAVNGAFADTPASQVSTQTVQAAQTYPVVPANGEGWFDVGGFCKVVDVGDLSALSPPASGVPVFVPGPADQWENYRQLAATGYNARLILTTCCRPQTDIAQLCTEAGATVLDVSRQYGKLGEVDAVTATCIDQWGRQYQDEINVACEVSGGGADGPDAQGVWAETGADVTSGCTANAFTSACTVSCGGGTQQTFDSCGNVTATTACNTQACCTPSMVTTGCSGSCGAGAGSQSVYDANNCPGSPNFTEACTVGPVANCDPGPFDCATETTAIATGYDCADGCWNATSFTFQSCVFSSLSADLCGCDSVAAAYNPPPYPIMDDTCLPSPIPGVCPPPPLP